MVDLVAVSYQDTTVLLKEFAWVVSPASGLIIVNDYRMSDIAFPVAVNPHITARSGLSAIFYDFERYYAGITDGLNNTMRPQITKAVKKTCNRQV